ncbi:hypothetical protein [Methylobacterium sp. J-090]|uniref:hypothetical protein n=1 Tax=Methylobacterium sp. J-090 TaxID=2836666 RepID=UPI001FB87744|nr:hypothetical protein [Methylobacterium sp. J-090]MCJ2079847.1 hypothetical protein [Methylobacterium sp. J-090]
MQNAMERRLAVLEAAKATARSGAVGLPDLQRLMIALIACHLGEIREGEPMAQAMTRALEYGRSQDLSAALEAEDGTTTSLAFDARYRSAVERLLALRGTGLDDAGNAVACALRSLFYAIPERVRLHRFLDGLDPADMFDGLPEAPTHVAAVDLALLRPDDTNLQIAAHFYRATLIAQDEDPGTSRGRSASKTARQAADEYEAVLRGGKIPHP